MAEEGEGSGTGEGGFPWAAAGEVDQSLGEGGADDRRYGD